MDNDQQAAFDDGESPEIVIPKKYVFAGLGFILLLFLTFSGVLNRGYESKTIRFGGVSKMSQGSSFGPKRMFLRKDQVFTADYSAEIEHGGLRMHLSKVYAPMGTEPAGQAHLRHTGGGQLRVTVPKTGLYKLWILGSPDRNGYHLTYTVSWRTE